MDNKATWDAIKQPPRSALKTIGAGRLKGKSDINPQWRYEAMTEQFGMCGIGWTYTIDRLWNEPASAEQVFAFAQVSVFYKLNDEWSKPIQGIGGSMLVTKESAGLHSSDEGYKMAITDALGTAMKMLGMAADIYAGKWDGSKYVEEREESDGFITEKQIAEIKTMLIDLGRPEEKMCEHFKVESVEKIPAKKINEVMSVLKASIKAVKKKKSAPLEKAEQDLKTLIANKNKELGVPEPGSEG